ncbi:MAG: ComEA family DNA-binding protein [Hydrogeniiclostridium sp.]
MIEVKIRDKVICWAAIVVFAFFALIGLLGITSSVYTFSSFSLIGFVPLILWLILGALARSKRIWAFFFGTLSIYVLLFVLTNSTNSYENNTFLTTVIYICIQAYMIFPCVYCIVRFRKLAATFAYAFSPQAKQMKKQKKLDLWEEEIKKSAPSQAAQSPKAQPADIKEAVSQILQKQDTVAEASNQPNASKISAAPPARAESLPQTPSVPLSEENKPAGKLDVNSCSADDLLSLPGMSISSAQAAVASRAEQGPYRSPDDFIQRNQIKPHFAVQILQQIETPASAADQPKMPTKRRSLDL